MDSPFVGRTAELGVLEAAFSADHSGLIPLYGRRRVGKTELIRRFMQHHRGVYFLGKQAAAPLQIREFLQEAAAAIDDPLLATAGDTWEAALTAVVDRWRGPGKLILALDEFQWTVSASPELPSVIQGLWDRHWKNSGNVLLVLCGSFIGFMEREILGRKSPLFGRRSAQIFLRPFGFLEAGLFHPGLSLDDRARIYFLCGGIPFYLKQFSANRSVEQNIVAEMLDEFAPLSREPDFLLREELREVENYYAVLGAIASGRTSHGDIATASGIGQRALHYYLQQLIELGYVSRRYPLTGAPPAIRHVRFFLQDPLLRFWFRFVFPNSSYIAQMGPQRAFRDRIRPHLPAYSGFCFEQLCREALPALYRKEGFSGNFQVGEYWDTATQIDVVGLRDDNWTDLGECKWGPIRSLNPVLDELKAKSGKFPNTRGASIGHRVFTRASIGTPSSRDYPGVRFHRLEDLYGTE